MFLAMLEQDAKGHSLLDRNLAEIAHETLAHDLSGNDALPSTIPREFGPYRILKLLGEGGMGVVYLAERIDLGTQIAIKILRDACSLLLAVNVSPASSALWDN